MAASAQTGGFGRYSPRALTVSAVSAVANRIGEEAPRDNIFSEDPYWPLGGPASAVVVQCANLP